MSKDDATQTLKYDEKAFKKLPQVSQLDLQAQAYHYAGQYRTSVEKGAERIKEAGQALVDHVTVADIVLGTNAALQTRQHFNTIRQSYVDALDQAVSDFNFAERMTASWHQTYETYTAWLS